MIDYYRKKFSTVFVNETVDKLVPVDFEALKKDKEYVQSLKTWLGVNIPYLAILNRTKDEAEHLKKDIEDYLK